MKKMWKYSLIVFALTTLVVLSMFFSNDVLARKGEIHIWQMACPYRLEQVVWPSDSDQPVWRSCSPGDPQTFCAGKGDGLQCELGIFEGSWLVRLACTDCSAAPSSVFGGEAETCRSNSDCRSTEECVIRIRSSRLTKLLVAAKLQPNQELPRGMCELKSPTVKSCSTNANCGTDELCYQGKCVAY